MVKCRGCGVEITGKTNGSPVYTVCRECLPRYFKGEFGDLPMVADVLIEHEANKKKGIAPYSGVSKKKAKNLTVSAKLNMELHGKLLKSIEENKKSMSEHVRNIIELHYNNK